MSKQYEMLVLGEGATPVTEGVEAECEEETGFTDVETQVEDNGAGGKQTEGWRIHS